MGQLFTYAYGGNWGDGTGNRGEVEARLVSLTYEKNKSDLQTGNGLVVLVREWRDYDTQSADTFIDALTDTIENPQADGQSYTGTFTSQKVENIAQGDRAVTIRQTLTLADTGGTLNSALKARWREDAETIVDLYYYWGQTVDQYEAALANWDTHADAETADLVTVTPSPYSVDRDGAGNFTIRVETRQARDINTAAGSFAATGQFSTETEFEKQKEWKELGVDPDTGSVHVVTAAAGYIKSQNVRVNADDSWDIVSSDREAQAVADVENRFVADQFKKEDVLTARNETGRESETATQTGLDIVSTRSVKNDFGLYDNSVTTETAIPVADVRNDYSLNNFESVDLVTARNESSREAETTSFSVGSIKTTSSEKNEFGQYDNSLRTESAVQNVAGGTDDARDAFSTRTTTKYINNSSTPAPAAPSGGVIVSTRETANQYGLSETARTVETGTEVGNGTDITKDALSTTTTAKNINASVEAEASGYSSGTLSHVRNRVNRFGLYDTENITEAASALTGGTAEDNAAMVSRSGTSERNSSVNPPTASAGTNSKTGHRSIVNRFGRFDTNSWTETATPTDGGSGNATGYWASTTSEYGRYQTTPVSPATTFAAGTMERIRNVRNDFGSLDTYKDTTVAVEGKRRDYDSKDNFKTVSVETTRNADEATTAGSFSAGTITEIDTVTNDFGLVDETETTTVASAVAIATKHDRESAFETLDSTTSANTVGRTSATGSSDGVITETRSVVNRFGRFDELIQTRTSKAMSATSSTASPLLSSTTTTTVHSATGGGSASASTGSVVTDESTPDEFGRFTRRETTESGVAATFSASYSSDNGSKYFEAGVNATAGAAQGVASGLTGVTNSFSANINKYGLINYSASSASPGDDADIDTDSYASYTLDLYKKIGDKWWDVTVTYKFSRYMTTAAGYATAGSGKTIGGYGGHTTGVKLMSNGLRAGCRVSVPDVDTPNF